MHEPVNPNGSEQGRDHVAEVAPALDLDEFESSLEAHGAGPGDAAHDDAAYDDGDTYDDRDSFDDGDADDDAEGQSVGYRGVTACSAAGITYRQLDYWARTGLVVPSVRDASGSGTQRLYSFRDIVVLKVVKRLLDAGVSLQNIRKAIETL